MMNNDTLELLKSKYNYNKLIIKNKLWGYGISEYENKVIDMIIQTEKLDDNFNYKPQRSLT